MVSGMRSPSSLARNMMNWPAFAFRATSGASITIFVTVGFSGCFSTILNMLCEGFRTTVFRQTMFAEFELNAHEALENGTVLTAEELNEMYMKLEKEYYEGIGVPEIMQYEWSYIPHFYRNFYVYQYATGYCSAVKIAENLLKTGDPSEYLRFLTTGGSAHPIDELKIAGVDLTDPSTVASALQTFDRTVKELGELLEQA